MLGCSLSNKTENNKYGEKVEKLETLYIAAGNVT